MTLRHWAALAAGAALILGGYLLGSGPYDDRQRFEHAGLCAATAVRHADCVTRSHAVVVSRSTETHDDPDPPDPNWPPQPQPPPPPVQPPIYFMRPAHVLASQTTTYTVVLRTDDGRRHTFDVGYGLYHVARTGAQANVDRWHGRIKRISIGTHSDDQWSTWKLTLAWLIAWTGVMLIVTFAPPFEEDAVGAGFGAWWGGFVGYLIVGRWGPAWYVLPLVVAGAVVLVKVNFAVADARRYPRRRWR